MTDKPTPTDAELFEVIREAARGGAVRRDGSTSLRIASAVLAKWGQPAQAAEPVAREQLTPEQIQDLLLCGNPTDEEMRLIRIGWDAAHGIKGGQP